MAVQRNYNASRFFQVRPLQDGLAYGAIVSGFDPVALSDPAFRSALLELWTWEGVLVFEGLYGEDTQLELSQIFGRCIVHPARETNEGAPPGLINVKFDPADGWLVSVDGETRGQFLPWHSDLVYVDRINHGGILRPIQLPTHLGETGFTDKITAYSLLPPALRKRIETLHVRYQYDLNLEHQRFGRRHNVNIIRYSDLVSRQLARHHEYPTVLHPMVFTQAETGRKVLNASPWFAVGIHELPGAEGDDLLEEVLEYALDDSIIYYHHWKMSQMVLWDNWRTLHCAVGSPPDQIRFLRRTTIDGDYGLGRLEDSRARRPYQYISV